MSDGDFVSVNAKNPVKCPRILSVSGDGIQYRLMINQAHLYRIYERVQ